MPEESEDSCFSIDSGDCGIQIKMRVTRVTINLGRREIDLQTAFTKTFVPSLVIWNRMRPITSFENW